MKKLFSLSIVLLTSVFLMGSVMGGQIKYPDTTQCKGSLLNVADIGDKTKYVALKAMLIPNNPMGLVVSYHTGLGDVYPTYVSLLWHKGIVVGFVYYDNEAFGIWMKPAPEAPVFDKIAKTPRNQLAFQLDFQSFYKKEFSVSQIL